MAEDEIITEESTDQSISRQMLNRRSFLKKGAIAGVGVAALYAAPQMSSVTARPAYASITGTTTPTWLEVEEFLSVTGLFHIAPSGGGTVSIGFDGTATVHVKIGEHGETPDPPGSDGRDQVQTEIVELNLSGFHPDFGINPVVFNLNPLSPSQGRIEEHTNNTSGFLDVPPFTPSGSADSFFDVFFEIAIPGSGTLTNIAPFQMGGTITNQPPAEGDPPLNSVAAVELYDENGLRTDFYLTAGSLLFGPAE